MKCTRILATLAVIALLACGEEERPQVEPTPLPEPAQPAPDPQPTAPSAELEPSADELPVMEDFEPEAQAEITAANYREELDRLEREIASQR